MIEEARGVKADAEDIDATSPEAHGTYGQTDFSKAAQKSRIHVEPETDGPHFSNKTFVPSKSEPSNR